MPRDAGRPLGKLQLRMLLFMASPGCIHVVPDAVARSLQRRGYLEPPPGWEKSLRISANGLRALADAHEARLLDQFMKLPAASRRTLQGDSDGS